VRHGLAGIHAQHSNGAVIGMTDRNLTGLEIDNVAVVGGAHLEPALEQRYGGALILRHHAELRAFNDRDEVRALNVELSSLTLGYIIESITARLNDAVDRLPRHRRRGNHQLRVRCNRQCRVSLPQLDRTAGSCVNRCGQRHHVALVHIEPPGLNRYAHIALH
jgi:hypothetical protein